MSIQPVTKAAEHNYLTNSILVLKKKQEKERKKKAVKAYLIKNSKGEEGEGGGHYHKQSEGLGGVLYHSPSYVNTSRCSRNLRLSD